MLPSGTAKADRKMGFALFQMGRKQQKQKVHNLLIEVSESLIGADEISNCRVAAVQGAQARLPMRIGKEAAVKDHIDAARHPALIAEALHRDRKPPGGVGFEPAARIVHVQGVSTAHLPYRMLVEHHRSVLRWWWSSNHGAKRLLVPFIVAGLGLRLALAVLVRSIRRTSK